MLDELQALYVELYELDVAPADVSPDESLFGLGTRFGLDSMDTLRFIAVLHSRYDFDLGTMKTETFRTFRSIEQALAPQSA